MSDQPYDAPNRTPDAPRQPRPTGHLWAIRLDGRQYDGELLDHGIWGVEFQVAVPTDILHFPVRVVVTPADARRTRLLRAGHALRPTDRRPARRARQSTQLPDTEC